MSRLQRRTVRVSLARWGEAWADAYIDFHATTWADTTAAKEEKAAGGEDSEAVLGLLKRQFVTGRAPGLTGQPIDLTADDLIDLDLDMLIDAMRQLNGEVIDPNV